MNGGEEGGTNRGPRRLGGRRRWFSWRTLVTTGALPAARFIVTRWDYRCCHNDLGEWEHTSARDIFCMQYGMYSITLQCDIFLTIK